MSSNDASEQYPNFDVVMIAELRRITAGHVTLEMELIFESALHKVCEAMRQVFGDIP